jgi:hypothetical protein
MRLLLKIIKYDFKLLKIKGYEIFNCVYFRIFTYIYFTIFNFLFMIIGLTGNIGCGKDTVGKMIQYYFAQKYENKGFNKKYTLENQLKYPANLDNYSDWKIKKFAYKLKQIAAILVGCNAEDF